MRAPLRGDAGVRGGCRGAGPGALLPRAGRGGGVPQLVRGRGRGSHHPGRRDVRPHLRQADTRVSGAVYSLV